MVKIIFLLLALFSFGFAKNKITVTLPIQKYFIEKIAQNEFYVYIVEKEYKKFEHLDKYELNQLTYSDYYFIMGLENEPKYIKLFTKKNDLLKIIDITKGIKKDSYNGKVIPYIWMDPILSRELAKNIYEQLSSIMSYKEESFYKNYQILLNELDDLFLNLKSKLDESEFFNVYVYDTYWHYFAKRFRINLYYKEHEYMLIEDVRNTILQARKHDIRKILIEQNKNYHIAASLANNIGADIVEHNIHLYDYRANLYALVQGIIRTSKEDLNKF